MSTSEYGGIIEYDPDELAADEPMDTPLVRRVINNANHYADQAGQVVCNWVAIDSALGGKPMGLVYPDDLLKEFASVDGWHRFGMSIRWDAKVRGGGDGYRLRVGLAGAVSPSIGSPVDYAIVVGPAGAIEPDVGGPGRVTEYVTGVTSTTAQTLALDSGDTWIDVPGSVVGAARDAGALQPTPADIGGVDVTVTTARMEVTLFGRGVAYDASGITNAPVLHQVYIAEYIGP